ncbi:MAG: HEAT repeat domain-containing protein [Candidatus Latescibacteria bacterium]|nr:HEAT repeat domain-containing protein [Candidatus Latescibacterota bacterium]
MNHQRIREWLHLSLSDELSDQERHLVEDHLTRCERCRLELEQLKQLYGTLEGAGRPVPSEQLLWEARQGLRAVLRMERSRHSLWERVTRTISAWAGSLVSSRFPGYAVAAAGLALFAVGLYAGSRGVVPAVFRPQMAVQTVSDEGSDPLAAGDVEITNVQFLDADAKDGQIEFIFEAIRPVHIKGDINDPRIQKVLTYAIINEQNPGVRLRAVNAIKSSPPQSSDSEIKAALITALKTDDNPGVRNDAFAALQKYPFDEDIKNAFLYVLTHDTNAALRITAINVLQTVTGTQRRADQDIVNVLKSRVESDENTYIRTRARAVLEEIKQQ